MEITKERRGDGVEMKASGRLDEHWSSHVAASIDETIRQGAHRIWFNMANVTYLSSAGMGILVGFYKQLAAIDGSFAVIEPSATVRKLLDMTNLSPLLLRVREAPDSAAITERQPTRTLERENAVFDVFDVDPNARFQCSVIGDPTILQERGYGAEHARTVTFDAERFGLGLGAFGTDFEECRSRYGEFLAVAGAAAYLPTDGSSVPDYIVATGSLVPEVNVLNALICEGSFAAVARFDAGQNERVITLSEIAEAALDIAGVNEAAVAMVAETAGLVGAALRKSPVASEAEPAGRFTHPAIRTWISFTGEPAYAGSLCVIVGVASRNRDSRLASMLRPMSKRTEVSGHFHAAACRYRPTKKTEIDLNATVKPLMEAQSLQGVLHLLSDLRQADGAGESEFIRGACWVGPIRVGEAAR